VIHHDEASGATLAQNTASWHITATSDGKPRTLAYARGASVYKQRCDKIKEGGASQAVI